MNNKATHAQNLKDKTFAVVGATGKTGARVLAHLQWLGYNTHGLSRNSERVFDWENQATWQAALEGVDSVYLTYYPDLAVPQAEGDIREFIRIAKAQGISHIVLLSGRGEEGAERAENIVKESGITWNIVRAGWFMQNFSESYMVEGLQAGTLVLPEPKSLEPFIDADDIAEVAVAALTQPELNNQLFELTGPQMLSFNECVAQIAKACGREIGFQTAPIDEYLAAATAQGLPESFAWLINELFVNVLDGRNAFTTNTVEQVLGRPAKSFSDYVAETVQTGVWSQPNTLQTA